MAAPRLRWEWSIQSGRVLARNECPTDVQRGFDHAMRQVTTLLHQCAERAKVKLDGIGIGCAGPLDSATGTLGNVNNLPGWKGGNPADILSRKFGVAAALENDADAAALGELRWGTGKAEDALSLRDSGNGHWRERNSGWQSVPRR